MHQTRARQVHNYNKLVCELDSCPVIRLKCLSLVMTLVVVRFHKFRYVVLRWNIDLHSMVMRKGTEVVSWVVSICDSIVMSRNKC